MRAPQSELVYLVRGNVAGRDAWHYVLLDKLKQPLFEQMLKSETMDVAKYGRILHSGWGENPPEHITQQIKSQYGPQ